MGHGLKLAKAYTVWYVLGRIWEHLLEIAQSSLQTTIVVTTHYIEEARQADRVGTHCMTHTLVQTHTHTHTDVSAYGHTYTHAHTHTSTHHTH